jgi:hypothetical protein
MYPSAMHPSGAALFRTLDLKFPRLLVYTDTRQFNCRQLGLQLNQNIYIHITPNFTSLPGTSIYTARVRRVYTCAQDAQPSGPCW